MIQKVLLTILVGGVVLALATATAWGIRTKLAVTSNSPTPIPATTTNPSPTPKSSPTSPPQTSSKPLSHTEPIAQFQITTNNSGLTTVEISQDQLNAQIKAALVGQSLGSTPLGEAKITDANVVINSGSMVISGTAQNGPLSLPFETKATLTLENNQPKLGLSDLSMNGIALPQLIADQLASSLQSKVNGLINSYHFQLKSIELQPGKIILTGQK